MFQNEYINSIFKESESVTLKGLVLAEWNFNDAENLLKIGNYRHRPLENLSKYKNIINSYDSNDSGNYYTDATNADIVVDGGYDDSDEPQLFTSIKEKEGQLFSLEDCFNKFRPRSGINKIQYFNNKYFHNSNSYLANRPRYYMSDKRDYFKYWSSYRTEDNIERGIAKNILNNKNYIDDVAPFVVYKNSIPVNRIVIKMQTNVGEINLGPFSTISENIEDPFYGYINQTTPSTWKVQVLNNDNWIDIISFDENSTRSNGKNIVGSDGHVELKYGLVVPSKYKDKFSLVDIILSTTLLPDTASYGDAYLVSDKYKSEIGVLYVYNGFDYDSFVPEYGWDLLENEIDKTSMVTELVDVMSYTNAGTSSISYKEFQYINGIRIVISTMNKFDSVFDLIELSPRLLVDITDNVTNYTINKSISDLSTNGLPVGQLLASTGNLELIDPDLSFNKNNTNSVVHKYLNNNVKFSFYESVETDDNIYQYIPLKKLYSDNIPQTDVKNGKTSIQLRDLYFYLEQINAPSLFLTNVSLSFVVSTLLDYTGFSNYIFKKIENEQELIIPFFFCNEEKNVAQVLNDLAISSQSSMFFNEENDLVVMSKNYTVPKLTDRVSDITLYGSKNNEINNKENILNAAIVDTKVLNSGKINYTTRYIQKTLGSIKQATLIDKEKTWIYKPTLLWEVSGKSNTKTVNESAASMSSYVLAAIPLGSSLSNEIPSISNNVLLNNTIDLGENIYWISNYNGYFYSNGEVIRYDAVEYSVSGIGNVWITNVEDYENYFSQLPFNGKMYPTGLIRIYTDLDYVEINGIKVLKEGDIVKHGRGQFETQVTNHYAGLNPYWTNENSVKGCNMYSEYLFADKELDKTVVVGAAGVSNAIAKQTTRTSIIKNFLSSSYTSEYDSKNSINKKSGNIQSSALVMTGPSFTFEQKPINYINYVYKPLDSKFKHFGTRLRIIGKVENNEVRGQTPIGSMTYYVVPGTDPSQNISIGGGSGGLGVMVNPTNNVGYYFEIAALTETNIDKYANGSTIANLMFYKIGKDSATDMAVPVKLWSGSTNILVDDGNFTGQYRMTGESNPTVYDLAVEYLDIGQTRKFYLYINNNIVAIVDDTNPLPIYNNMCLFTRGTSKIMFENIFALGSNYAKNVSENIDIPFNKIFNNQEITSNDAFRKYALSSVIQSTYLSGISPSEPPSYNFYFDEFGSIMRECAYFNVKFDKAYPALYSKISPTFNKIKGYTVSGFLPDAYGAEFLIFNATDTVLSLDETSGNYLRIQGVAFTQSTNHTLTVEDYYKENSNYIKTQYLDDQTIKSNTESKDKYNKLKISKSKYGTKEFTMDTPYIQSKDDAESLLGWIVNKTIDPKNAIGLDIFATPTIQLGDIVNIYYKNANDEDIIASENKRFVVYNIEYARSAQGPTMKLYCYEVADE
jgi:hypothetical protein